MEKTYTVSDWIQAYEEKVRDVLNYQNYHLKASARKQIERLKNAYPEANPFTFFQAMFDSNNWWGTRNKKGEWKKIKYPFPSMLLGAKADNIYHKYLKQHKKEMGSKQDEILEGVVVSLNKLKVLNVKLDNFSELFYFTIDLNH